MPIRKAVLTSLIAFIFIIGGCGGKKEEQNQNTTPPPLPQGHPIQPPFQPLPQEQNYQIYNSCPKEIFTIASLDEMIINHDCENISDASLSFKITKSGDELAIAITISGKDIFSSGFYMAYDPYALEFFEYQSGVFFGNNSQSLIRDVRSDEEAALAVFSGCKKQPEKRVIILGHSVIGNNSIGITGNDVVGTLKFRIKSAALVEFFIEETAVFKRTSIGALPEKTLLCYPSRIQINI